MLQFDGATFTRDLILKCNSELNKIAKILVEYMVYEISAIPVSGSIEAVAKPDWRLDVIEALRYVIKAEGLSLVANIGIIDQKDDNLMMKAMIVEFGMGTEADVMGNEWIDEYYSSQYYHADRGGMNVYGRKGKDVYDIDDDAWYESEATHNSEITRFRQVGSHFWTKIFGNSANLAEDHFLKAIDNICNGIDLSKYLMSK